MKRGWIGAALVGIAIGSGMLMGQVRPREVLIAGYRTPLQGRTPNQRYNAIRALERIQGTVIKPGETFSFNRVVKSWSRDQGFRKAPVSFSGTLVPAYGGGVCQTSTTLYNAALLSGLPILKRQAHRFSPSYAPPGRDAAVAFESVDLEFKNPYPYPIKIIGSVRHDDLIIQVVGPRRPSDLPVVREEIRKAAKPRTIVWQNPEGKGMSRVRSRGREGFEVLVWRIWGDERELISQNSYPAMDRVVEAADTP